MAVQLKAMRDAMLPGLKAQAYEYAKLREQWEKVAADVFNNFIPVTTKTFEFTLDEIHQAEDIIKGSGS